MEEENNSLSTEQLRPDPAQELPYNLEAEQAVVGSVLTDSSSVADAAEMLNPEDFYFANNRMIFSAVLELFNSDEEIDFLTVSEKLKHMRPDRPRYRGETVNLLESAGGIDYLKKLAMSVPTTQHVKHYSGIIKEKSILRSLIKSMSRISQKAYNEEGSLSSLLEQSEQSIFDITSSREKNDLMHVSDVLQISYENIAKSIEKKGGITGYDTGFHELNRVTGGFHGGELIIIAGRPAMGKSTFAVNIVEHMSISEHEPVAIFNLEMPAEQIVNRILCSQALVHNSKIQTGRMEPDDWVKLCDKADRIAMAPLYIDDTSTITVSQIRAKCRRLKQTRGLSAIVIDYLQLMQSSGRSENRQQEIAEISRSLKILAKELDVPIIALSQLKRDSESQKGKRPMLSDLRESGAIEQDADLVMFLNRKYVVSHDPEDKEKAECIIAKNRHGEIKDIPLGFKGEYYQFRNVELREEPPGGEKKDN